MDLRSQVGEGVARCDALGLVNRVVKFATMPHDDDALAILWHTMVDRVQKFELHDVAQSLEFSNDRIQIVFVAIHQPAHILKHPNVGLGLLDSRYECRKSVTCVANAVLVPPHAEWLAWRATNDDLCLGKNTGRS